jgi:hypothetical protein
MDALDEILRQHDALKAERTTWESQWQTLADYVRPTRGDFTARQPDGGRRVDQIFDPTAIWANEQLAAGLSGLLTNPAMRWFGLKARDERLNRVDAVKRWLEAVTERLYAAFNRPRANFHPQAHELYLDLGAFGTSAMLIDDDPALGPTFATRHLGECFIAENAAGIVDTLHREFQLTARAAVQLWGEAVPEPIGRAAETDPGRRFTFVHAVRPRAAWDPTSKLKTDKPWASVYFNLDFKQPISVGGYDEFPYVVPRWAKVTGETYGRSPGMTALPTILLLNSMMKTVIMGAQKRVDPPLMAPDDGFVLPIRATPGKVIFYRAGTPQYDRIQPLDIGGDPGLGLEMIQVQRSQIEQIFHTGLLMMAQGPQKTATEVLQIREEKYRLLGPIVARQEAEYLDPLIERVFRILLRRGELPAPPDELQGAELEVEYTSPILQAQKGARIEGVVRVLEAVEWAGAIDPGVANIVDAEALVREIGDTYQAPLAILRSPEDVAALRRSQAEAQARERALTEAGAEAALVKDLAQADATLRKART